MRILIVEDEPLVALDIGISLEDAGCIISGPAYSLDAGLMLAAKEALDGAILDFNLGNETSMAIAMKLHERGIPFVIATGYIEGLLPAPLGGQPIFSKPLSKADLMSIVAHFEPVPIHVKRHARQIWR